MDGVGQNAERVDDAHLELMQFEWGIRLLLLLLFVPNSSMGDWRCETQTNYCN